MSEKKPKEYAGSDELEGVLLEIQRVAVKILTTARMLSQLEKEMETLQARRNELRGGQNLFTLD